MPSTVKALDNKSSDVVADLEREHGRSNAFLRVMAHRPEILRAFKPFHDTVMGAGALDRRIKTLVYLATSYVNESPYDVSHTHKLALEEGFSEEDVRAVRMEQDNAFSPMEHAAVKVARELTRTCTLDDIESNELNVFTAEQMVELVSVVSLANFENRFSNALDVEQKEAASTSDPNPNPTVK